MVNRFDQSAGISFGCIDNLQLTAGSVSFIIILVLVVCIEHIFFLLHESCEETPIEMVVQRIEKELMIVGGCAFLIKVILNSSAYDGIDWFHDWAFALEFADLVLPITSLIYVLTGLVLFRVSQTRCRLYERCNNLTLLEIMHEFAEDNSKPFIKNRYLSNVYNSISSIEFRVLYNLFYEESRIAHGTVNFAEYVRLSFDKFLISIVTIQPKNWTFIIVLILLNLGRVQLGLEIYSCDDNDNVCFQDRSQVMFIFMGWLMFVIYAAIAFLARVTELNLMLETGINDVNDLGTFLQLQEEKRAHSNESDRRQSQKLTEKELKQTIESTRKMHLYNRAKSKRFFGRNQSKIFFGTSNHSIYDDDCDEDRENCQFDQNITTNTASIENQQSEGGRSSFQKHVMNVKIKLRGANEKKSIFEGIEKIRFYRRLKMESNGSISDSKFVKLFFFHNPELFFFIIDGMVMPTSFYLSLWICNFLPWAVYSENAGIYIVLSVIPFILSTLLMSHAVLVASLMRCVCSLDPNIINEVLEQAETSKIVSDNLRSTIISRLDVNKAEETLMELFNSIDDDDSKSLSRKEFRRFLRSMKITFSKKKWRIIFNEIDKNNDDEIAFDEFFIFLYPNSKSALEKEETRLLSMHERLQVMIETQNSHQSDFEYDESKRRIAQKIKLDHSVDLKNIKRNSFSTYSILELRSKSFKQNVSKIAIEEDDESEDDSINEDKKNTIENDKGSQSFSKSLKDLSHLDLIKIIEADREKRKAELEKFQKEIQLASQHEQDRVLNLTRKFSRVIEELEEKIVKIGVDFQNQIL